MYVGGDDAGRLVLSSFSHEGWRCFVEKDQVYSMNHSREIENLRKRKRFCGKLEKNIFFGEWKWEKMKNWRIKKCFKIESMSMCQ